MLALTPAVVLTGVYPWIIDGLVQDCGNSSVLAMELPLPCTES